MLVPYYRNGVVKIKQAGQCQIATCSNCQHQWVTRKDGAGKKCPRCQRKLRDIHARS